MCPLLQIGARANQNLSLLETQEWLMSVSIPFAESLMLVGVGVFFDQWTRGSTPYQFYRAFQPLLARCFGLTALMSTVCISFNAHISLLFTSNSCSQWKSSGEATVHYLLIYQQQTHIVREFSSTQNNKMQPQRNDNTVTVTVHFHSRVFIICTFGSHTISLTLQSQARHTLSAQVAQRLLPVELCQSKLMEPN